jgi:hypothetical protein
MAGITDALAKANPYVQLAEVAGTLGLGAYQIHKANQLKKNLVRPVYDYTEAKAANAGQLALAQGEAPGLAQQMQGVNQGLANTTDGCGSSCKCGSTEVRSPTKLLTRKGRSPTICRQCFPS